MMLMPFGKHKGISIKNLKLSSISWYLGYDLFHGKCKLPFLQNEKRLFVRYNFPDLYLSLLLEAVDRKKCFKCYQELTTCIIHENKELYLLDESCLNKYFDFSPEPENQIKIKSPTDECHICMDESTEPVYVLPCCKQVIHVSCLDKCPNNKCPYCQTNIESKSTNHYSIINLNDVYAHLPKLIYI